MSKRDILELAIRIIGLCFFAYVLSYTPTFFSLILTLNPKDLNGAGNVNLYKAFMILHLLMALSISWLLFQFSSKLATKVYSKEEGVLTVINIDNRIQFFKLSLKILGVYFILSSIISFLNALPMIGSLISGINTGMPIYIFLKHTISPLIGILLGLYLLISGEIFVKLAYRSDSANLAKSQD